MSVKSRPCQQCGKEIEAIRIEVYPQTRLCIECSKGTNEFDISTKTENLAKEGSLKKNYGSFEMTRTRRPIQKQDKP